MSSLSRKSNEESPPIMEDMKCTVCTNLYRKPTFFECGHTFCLRCHYNIDKNTECKTFECPSFKCPICRQVTSIPWNLRPPNLALDTLCHTMYPSEYKELEEKNIEQEADTEKKKTRINYSRIDLSQVAFDSQKRKSQKVYDQLMPLFFKECLEGKSFITITEEALVRDIEICIQPLTKLLFEKNNLYKINCTPKECSVYFSDTAMQWAREFLNENHTSQNHGLEPTSPPPPPSARSIRNRFNTTASRRRNVPSSSDDDLGARILLGDIRSIVRDQFSSHII